jgi:hypothetical protein
MGAAIELEFKDGDGSSNWGDMIGVNITVLDDGSYLVNESYEEFEYTCSFRDKKSLLKYLGELL